MDIVEHLKDQEFLSPLLFSQLLCVCVCVVCMCVVWYVSETRSPYTAQARPDLSIAFFPNNWMKS